MATDSDSTGSGIEDRVEQLETGQGRLMAKLDEILGIVGTGSKAHAAAQAREERHLSRPTTVEEQVRAELDRKEQAAADKTRADDDKTERQTMRETLAKLTEAKPVQPQPRRQRVMWGKQ
jgi:hypothetical protein